MGAVCRNCVDGSVLEVLPVCTIARGHAARAAP